MAEPREHEGAEGWGPGIYKIYKLAAPDSGVWQPGQWGQKQQDEPQFTSQYKALLPATLMNDVSYIQYLRKFSLLVFS